MMDEIRQVEVLTNEEKQLLFGWGENIFGVVALKLSWRPKDLHFVLYSDGEPVSHVGVLKHVVSVNGEPATVGEWVASLPYRRRRRKDSRASSCGMRRNCWSRSGKWMLAYSFVFRSCWRTTKRSVGRK